MSNINCNGAGINKGFCESIRGEIIENDDKLESMQTQIYIISGVGGGVALVLIITLIALAIQLSSMRQKAAGLTKGKPTMKNSMSKSAASSEVKPQQSYPQQSQSPHSVVQQQQPPTASAEDELAQLGFAAYTGHPVEPRGFSSSSSPAVNSAGGVRVLPRNPHPNFRNNASNNGYNDGYM